MEINDIERMDVKGTLIILCSSLGRLGVRADPNKELYVYTDPMAAPNQISFGLLVAACVWATTT